MNIEVEIRSFISKEKYDELLEFFRKNGKFVSDDYQETHYFDSKEDLRIQQNNFFSKVWLKKGKLHDESREEIEIKFDRKDFENLQKIFAGIGLGVQIKWFRQRHTFEWEGVSVMVDCTKGYGYILELEKMSDEKNKEKMLELLKQKMALLGIEQTPKEEFDKRFQHYKDNWRTLTS